MGVDCLRADSTTIGMEYEHGDSGFAFAVMTWWLFVFEE